MALDYIQTKNGPRLVSQEKELVNGVTRTFNRFYAKPLFTANWWTKQLRNPPMVPKWVTAATKTGSRPWGRNLALGAIGLAAGGIHQFFKQTSGIVHFKNQVESPVKVSYGSGYISWSKSAGMPANHLSTDGLSLALSKNRHVSTI